MILASVCNSFFYSTLHVWVAENLESDLLLGKNGRLWATRFAIVRWLLWTCHNDFIFNKIV